MSFNPDPNRYKNTANTVIALFAGFIIGGIVVAVIMAMFQPWQIIAWWRSLNQIEKYMVYGFAALIGGLFLINRLTRRKND